MRVRSANNVQRRKDPFSKKAVALKLAISAAAIVCVINFWLFQSYYTKTDIHVKYNDNDDDTVSLTSGGWGADEATQREEWEPVSAFDDADSNDVVVEESTAKDATTKEHLETFQSSESCYKARINTVPHDLYGKLQKPYLNVGFPKMGTNSLHNFFECGGFKSVHYRCSRIDSCARCMRESVEAGGLPLDLCELPPKKIDMYAQMDDGVYFPQIELLQELVTGYPKATLFLTFRPMEKWYNSLKKWPPRPNGPHFNEKLRKANITGFPSGVGKNVDEFSDWYCKHVERVRAIVDQNPSMTLVEVDIEDPTIAKRMSDIFDIDETCWGRSNVNPIANPDLDLSGVQIAKAFGGGKKKDN